MVSIESRRISLSSASPALCCEELDARATAIDPILAAGRYSPLIVSEQFCDVGRGVTLCYETFGDASDPTALLIMGLGTQMVAWHEDFCRELAGRGLHVVRFDNRDVGRSTHMSGAPPTVLQLLSRSRRAAHSTLADLA